DYGKTVRRRLPSYPRIRSLVTHWLPRSLYATFATIRNRMRRLQKKTKAGPQGPASLSIGRNHLFHRPLRLQHCGSINPVPLGLSHLLQPVVGQDVMLATLLWLGGMNDDGVRKRIARPV